MNQEFKQCLENKRIIPFARGKRLVKKEFSVAKSDLSDANAVIASAERFIEKTVAILNVEE